MKRFALGISYVGKRYCGYQSQGLGNSVQECVELAISKVANHQVKIMCAGRTDAGVHAMIQVVHFDSEAFRREDQWLKGINVGLPSDIKALWIQEMDESFHARFSATSRAYVYVLNPGDEDLFMDPYSWSVGTLNIEQMQMAANCLIGEHDFYAFQSRHCQSEHAVRCIHQISVRQVGRMVHCDIQANAFVHHMVRKIVATLVRVGQGKLTSLYVMKILKTKNRRLVPGQAPAKGLFLKTVRYPQNFEVPEIRNSQLIGD